MRRDAAEPQRRPRKRLDRRLEEVAKAVGGGYCRLQMPLRLAFAVRETVAGHGLGALEGGGGGTLPPSNASLSMRQSFSAPRPRLVPTLDPNFRPHGANFRPLGANFSQCQL